jgi:hypothetical protein
MTCFICNYCNHLIDTNNDIYYALDYNYCSHSCRLHHYRRLKYTSGVTDKVSLISTNDIQQFDLQPKRLSELNNHSMIKTIYSFKSVDNLLALENLDGNIVYRDISNCQTIIKFPLTVFTYFSDMIYRLHKM